MPLLFDCCGECQDKIGPWSWEGTKLVGQFYRFALYNLQSQRYRQFQGKTNTGQQCVRQCKENHTSITHERMKRVFSHACMNHLNWKQIICRLERWYVNAIYKYINLCVHNGWRNVTRDALYVYFFANWESRQRNLVSLFNVANLWFLFT